MSQYYFNTKEGRKVLYGLDKPTGGYFFTEFSTDEEVETQNADEVRITRDGLTFLEFYTTIQSTFAYSIPTKMLANLIMDWKIESDPTPLQYQIQRMFNIDLRARLERCVQEFEVIAKNKIWEEENATSGE